MMLPNKQSITFNTGMQYCWGQEIEGDYLRFPNG